MIYLPYLYFNIYKNTPYLYFLIFINAIYAYIKTLCIILGSSYYYLNCCSSSFLFVVCFVFVVLISVVCFVNVGLVFVFCFVIVLVAGFVIVVFCYFYSCSSFLVWYFPLLWLFYYLWEPVTKFFMVSSWLLVWVFS